MRKLRPAKQKPEGYYGNKPIKAEEGNGGLITTPHRMQDALPVPCVECPLRRDSAPGYLGGYTPEMYVEVLHGPASLACHTSPGFHTRQIDQQRHCTGVAAYRANVGHRCEFHGVPTNAQTAVNKIGPDHETYFSTPEEFVNHHKPGQEEA